MGVVEFVINLIMGVYVMIAFALFVFIIIMGVDLENNKEKICPICKRPESECLEEWKKI